jgi:hypothetical protein
VRPPSPPRWMRKDDTKHANWRFLVNEPPLSLVMPRLLRFLRSLLALYEDPLYMISHDGAPRPPPVVRPEQCGARLDLT